jgi:hypothetical protein
LGSPLGVGYTREIELGGDTNDVKVKGFTTNIFSAQANF